MQAALHPPASDCCEEVEPCKARHRATTEGGSSASGNSMRYSFTSFGLRRLASTKHSIRLHKQQAQAQCQATLRTPCWQVMPDQGQGVRWVLADPHKELLQPAADMWLQGVLCCMHSGTAAAPQATRQSTCRQGFARPTSALAAADHHKKRHGEPHAPCTTGGAWKRAS